MIFDVLRRHFDIFNRFDIFFAGRNQLLTIRTKIKFHEVIKKIMIHYNHQNNSSCNHRL